MKIKPCITISALLLVSATSFAQTDDVNNNLSGVNSTPIVAGGPGAVIGSNTFDAGITGGTPVGLEHDGSGTLLLTEITNDEAFTVNTSAALLNGPTSVVANTGNPIGISTNGTNLFITDTADQDVDIYDASYNYISSFDATGSTTFPEGITYASFDNNLYVVDGSGGNQVGQYDLAGTLLNTFPINGSSPDGIALDFQRCVFWIYDSGTDTVRSYDNTFNELDSFPGTIAAGFAGGEGLAVINNSLFVVSTGSNTLVEFDISNATTASNAGTLCATLAPPTPVPTLSNFSILLLVLTILLCGGILVRKFN